MSHFPNDDDAKHFAIAMTVFGVIVLVAAVGGVALGLIRNPLHVQHIARSEN